jgi:hypothetical protein
MGADAMTFPHLRSLRALESHGIRRVSLREDAWQAAVSEWKQYRASLLLPVWTPVAEFYIGRLKVCRRDFGQEAA